MTNSQYCAEYRETGSILFLIGNETTISTFTTLIHWKYRRATEEEEKKASRFERIWEFQVCRIRCCACKHKCFIKSFWELINQFSTLLFTKSTCKNPSFICKWWIHQKRNTSYSTHNHILFMILCCISLLIYKSENESYHKAS